MTVPITWKVTSRSRLSYMPRLHRVGAAVLGDLDPDHAVAAERARLRGDEVHGLLARFVDALA